ncbi:MAG: hypothetical protein LAP13_10725 [Acidobacteriia bacterium]|nr:hypothetical protein [Terriglobia bacterium]
MRAHRRDLMLIVPLSLALALFLITAQAVAADSLEGTWQHQRDSGGWKPLPGANITLRLDKGGHAVLTATAPNQNPLEVQGTWSVQGGRVTINIPDQFEIKNQPFQLQGDTVTFPSQLSEDKPGSSVWVRAKSQGIDMIFVAFNRALEEGKGGASAAQEAAKEARKQEGVEKVEVMPSGTGLVLTVNPGTPTSVKPKVHILFAAKAAPFTPPVQRKGPVSPLAADPRSHLVPQNPAGDPDAPKSRTALVVAPFHSKPYYAYKVAVFKEGDTKPRSPAEFAKSETFKELGDDPEGIAKQLHDKAEYDVTTLIDDQATPGAIFRALQSRPSVIYFATHGSPASPEDKMNAIAAGGFVGARRTDKAPGFLTPKIATQRLSEMLAEQKLPDAARAGVSTGCLERVGNFAFCFPMLWPKFFEVALGDQGVPDSFVFLDACYTAQYPVLAHSFKARAFLGYNDEMAGWATARFAKFLFGNLEHRGHSVREAWDRLLDICHGAGTIWLEDSIVSPVARGDVNLEEEVQKLQGWGIDQKPYDRVNAPVFWLMFMARWSNDINKGADTLQRCFTQYWGRNKRPGLADTFCNNGILGNHTPDQKEVEDARNLVAGKPTKPVGRFVLR